MINMFDVNSKKATACISQKKISVQEIIDAAVLDVNLILTSEFLDKATQEWNLTPLDVKIAKVTVPPPLSKTPALVAENMRIHDEKLKRKHRWYVENLPVFLVGSDRPVEPFCPINLERK